MLRDPFGPFFNVLYLTHSRICYGSREEISMENRFKVYATDKIQYGPYLWIPLISHGGGHTSILGGVSTKSYQELASNGVSKTFLESVTDLFKVYVSTRSLSEEQTFKEECGYTLVGHINLHNIVFFDDNKRETQFQELTKDNLLCNDNSHALIIPDKKPVPTLYPSQPQSFLWH